MAPRVWPAADREREIAEQPTWQLCPGASSYSYFGKHTYSDKQTYCGKHTTASCARGHLPTHTLASIPTAQLGQLPTLPEGIFFLILWQANLLASTLLPAVPRGISSSYSGKHTPSNSPTMLASIFTVANVPRGILLLHWQNRWKI